MVVVGSAVCLVGFFVSGDGLGQVGGFTLRGIVVRASHGVSGSTQSAFPLLVVAEKIANAAHIWEMFH